MRRSVIGLLVVCVVLATLPGLAAGQARVGSNVVVEGGETVSGDVRAVGTTVVVRGTVRGDLTAIGERVVVQGQVGGDVTAVGGTVVIAGPVGGDVRAAGGTVTMAEGSVVSGNLYATGGQATLVGAVANDVRVSASRLAFGSGLNVGGDFAYRGDLSRDGDPAIAGDVHPMGRLQGSHLATFLGVPGVAVPLMGVLVNLLGGAALLRYAPRFSLQTLANVARDPTRPARVGLGLTLGVPAILVALALLGPTLPLAVLGTLGFLAVALVGGIYGRFALGAWLLSKFDAEERWRSLGVGCALVGVTGFLPLLGWVARAAVLVLGLGAFALALDDRFEIRAATRDLVGGSAS